MPLMTFLTAAVPLLVSVLQMYVLQMLFEVCVITVFLITDQ